MALPAQTISLLEAARRLSNQLNTDAVLLLTETPLNWGEVRTYLGENRLLVAAHNPALTHDLKDRNGCVVLELDPEPVPIQERMNLALLKAIANEQIRPGSHVVVLYNGIAFEQ